MSIQKTALAIFILSIGLTLLFTQLTESASFSTTIPSITVESGAIDALSNISIKTEETGTKNITGISFVFPVGPFSASQQQPSAANISITPSITSSSTQPVNITFSNPNLLVGGSGATGYFSFKLNSPGGTSKENAGNKSIYTTIYVYDQDGSTTSSTITIYLNDSSKPSNLRFSSPTKANNAFTSNATGDFEVHFNEANPSSVTLTIGFSNGTLSNKSMAIQAAGQSGKATVPVAGFPEGKHNFTFLVTDTESFLAENSSVYSITTDLTPPTASLTLPSDATKGSTLTSTNLTCSASDSLSGVDATQTVTITKPVSSTKVTHTCGNSFTDTSETGDYSVSFTVQDKAGNSVTKTGSFKVKDTTAQDNSSVPSSPTAASSTTSQVSTPSVAQSVIAKTITASGNLTPGKLAAFPMPKEMEDRGLVGIQIESTDTLNSSDAAIESKIFDTIPAVDDKNQTLKALPASTQKMLKIFQITPLGKLQDKIKQANITFRLTKQELGNITAENIVLLRFSQGNWTELPTHQNSSQSQDQSLEFTSTTPGFSVFVVSSKTNAPIIQTNQTINPQESPANQTSEQSSAVSAKAIADGVPDYIFYIIAALTTAALGFIFIRKRKSKRPKTRVAKKELDYYKKIIKSN